MLAAALFLTLAAAEPGAVRRLPPVDQCAADPEFAQFRDALLAAIARRDTAHVLSAIADDIAVSFGGYEGRAGFVELWGLDRPQDSLLWETLETTLRLGCMVEDGGRISPSFYVQAGEEADLFDTFLAVVPGAPLRASPSTDGEVVARLDWDVLTLVYDEDGSGTGEQEGWYPVRLADGRSGFVEAAHARSLVDYRAFFERVGGRWRMTVFIAGD